MSQPTDKNTSQRKTKKTRFDVSIKQIRNGISLFSGMGGDTLGMENAGVKVVGFNEKEKIFIKTHLKNFEECNLIGDYNNSSITDVKNEEIEKFKGKKIDLVFAGFPCQGFSNAGKKKVNDPRNTLFGEFVRVAKIIRPKFIIGENVEGLLKRKTDTGDNYIDIIRGEFENLGYTIYHNVFYTERYNIPQFRRRLIIVGVKNDKKRNYEFPSPLNNGIENIPDLRNIIRFDMRGSIKIPETDFEKMGIPDECIIKDMDNNELPDMTECHPYLKLKAEEKNASYTFKKEVAKRDSNKRVIKGADGKTIKQVVEETKDYDTLLSFGKRDSPIHSEIIDIRKPSKTIICTYDHQPRLYVPLKNKQGYFIRCLLLDELKQIQGFPKDFKLCGNEKQKIIQIGNAVPPPLIKIIVESLNNYL
jgi:DNA (cytosine-5)-methyltransferase 1